MSQKLPYTLGLDVGVASIGWSIVGLAKDTLKPIELVKAGVRIFKAAETDKTGESLAKKRREARGIRRRLKRRKQRILELKTLLINSHLIESADQLLPTFDSKSPWEIRTLALDTKISDVELARAILHIAKRRGFKSNRKAETKSKENSVYYSAFEQQQALLTKGKYRTFGEMIFKDDQYSEKKRNTSNSYLSLAQRKDLEYELLTILRKQQGLGNKRITNDFINKVLEISQRQLPFAKKEDILALLGKCTFFAAENRLSKATITAQKFVLLQKINNLQIRDGRNNLTQTSLKQEDRQKLFNFLIYEDTCTYADIRKHLNLPGDETTFEGKFFSDLKYTQYDESGTLLTASAIEKNAKFISGNPIADVRKVFEKKVPRIWTALIENHDLFDSIMLAYVYNKEDESLTTELKALIPDVTDNEMNSLLEFSVKEKYQKPIHLSKRALTLLLPVLEQGKFYAEAVEIAIPPELRRGVSSANNLLPQIPTEEIRNPVVLRSLTQLRKVINAIIREHGSPTYIHLELARDIVKSKQERSKIEKEQKENQAKTEREMNEIRDIFKIEPTGTDLLKYRLWKQQQNKCIYSEKPIPAEKLFSDPTYTQIDHILPFSRSLDDSIHNKVLVLTAENQDKKDKIPFDYIAKKNMSRWERLVTWWEILKLPYHKLQKLQTHDFDDIKPDEFIARDLNDTKYIARYLRNFVENNLRFAESTVAGKQRLFTFNGKFTAMLRKKWGFNKDRSASDRHHALDATILALSSRSILHDVSQFAKKIEQHLLVAKTKEDRFYPTPWEHFRDDIFLRIFEDDPKSQISTHKQLSKRYAELGSSFEPLFVSRMVDHKVTGAAHAETVYGVRKSDGRNVLVVKKSITQLNKADFENKKLYLSDDPESERVLRERMIEFDWNAEKAFAMPIYKPSRSGHGNPIKSVRYITGPANVYVSVHGGTGAATNDSMVRVDVFQKDGKYFLVPIYVADTVKKKLPNKAIVAHADEEKWTPIDNSFDFRFSIYTNDYISVNSSGKIVEGYYVSTHRGTGAIKLRIHDNSNDKDISIGVKTAQELKKFQVDPLGKLTEIKKETRNGF